jgi:RecA-family ATPase
MDLHDMHFDGFADDEEPPRQERAANGKADDIRADWRSVLQPVRASDLAGQAVPPREWVVDEWVPERCPVLFTGPGGVGKTLLAMQLAVALTLGRDWLGLKTRRKRVLMMLCEDDGGEIHRRLDDITNGYGVRFEDLPDLVYLCRVGQENTLIGRTRNGLIGPTDLHGSLGAMIADEKIDVLIGDNARHLFDVEEQKGPDVTKAINLFHGLMTPTKGVSILLHHPNKAGTSEFSGSVAWEAAVRSRMFLGRIEPQGDSDK